jgi:hypothetical protein
MNMENKFSIRVADSLKVFMGFLFIWSNIFIYHSPIIFAFFIISQNERK